MSVVAMLACGVATSLADLSLAERLKKRANRAEGDVCPLTWNGA